MLKNIFDFRIYLLIFFSLWGLSFYWKKELFFKIRDYLDQKSNFIILLLSTVLFFYFLIFKYYSWQSGNTSGSDFSHFDYALWNISEGRGPLLSIDDTLYYKNIFGNHFAPILYLLASPYFFVSSHFLPYFYQVLFLLSGFLGSYFFTKNILGRYLIPHEKLLGLLFAICFLSFQYTLRVFKYEFHHEILYFPLGLWVIYEIILKVEFRVKRNLYFILSILFYLSVKEDAPLNLLGPCLWAFFKTKGKEKVFWSLLSVFFISYFFIIFKMIMPLYALDSTKNNFLPMWAKYGHNIVDISKSFISHPHWVFQDIFFNKTFLKVFIPWLFIPFFSKSFLLFLSSLALVMTGSDIQIKELLIYYSSPVIPFIFCSVVLGTLSYKKYINKFVCVFLGANLLIGIGTLRLDSSNSDVSILNDVVQNRINSVMASGSDHRLVYVTGGTLVFLNYHKNFRRLGEFSFKADLDPLKTKAVLIGSGINAYPLKEHDLVKIKEKLKELQYQREDISSSFSLFTAPL